MEELIKGKQLFFGEFICGLLWVVVIQLMMEGAPCQHVLVTVCMKALLTNWLRSACCLADILITVAPLGAHPKSGDGAD